MEKPRVSQYIVDLARQLRHKQTPAEESLWECLRNRRVTRAKFRRQYPLVRYIADFYCHEAGLVVELQGGVHSVKEQRDYDAVRQETIEQQGIRVITFANREVEHDLEGVLLKIIEALTPTTPDVSGSVSPLPQGEGAGGEG